MISVCLWECEWEWECFYPGCQPSAFKLEKATDFFCSHLLGQQRAHKRQQREQQQLVPLLLNKVGVRMKTYERLVLRAGRSLAIVRSEAPVGAVCVSPFPVVQPRALRKAGVHLARDSECPLWRPLACLRPSLSSKLLAELLLVAAT